MPKVQQKPGASRQRPVSCAFCRTRKLRCSRDIPCSNCVSRGLHCDLEDSHRQSANSPHVSEPEIVERLQKLEKYLAAQKAETDIRLEHTPESPKHNDLESQTPSKHQLASNSQISGVDSDVAWLESIYASEDLAGKIPSDKLSIKICPLQQVGGAPFRVDQEDSLSTTNVKPLRRLWLPQRNQAQVLLGQFINHASRLPYVVHIPSLPSIVDEVYGDLGKHGQVKAGSGILLLSVFAAATHSWLQSDCVNGPFSTPSEAHKQTSIWIEAMHDVLDIAQRSTSISTEGVQGIIIAAFVLAVIEGTTRRCRSLYATAMVLARELGLHRIGHPSNAKWANTLQAEMGRRVWWYLCASDWVMAARFNGLAEGVYSCHLRQMITKKPLNINDDEMFDGMSRAEHPLSRPTTMSYGLQRIRLAEVSRNIVDRMPLSMASRDGPSIDVTMDIDTELQMLINDIPPFFSMSQAELLTTYSLTPAQAIEVMYQGRSIYFLVYSQRCKLHLRFFSRGFVDAEYSASREICVQSARIILQSEVDIEATANDYATRFKFAGFVLGVFMASIVLLMDLCITKPSRRHERQRKEITQAFQILEEARNESETTARFVDSLMEILHKHKVPRPHQSSRRLRPDHGQQLQAAEPAHETSDVLTLDLPDRDSAYGNASDPFGLNHDNHIGSVGASAVTDEEELTSYFDELARSFDSGDDIGTFDWNNIFSSLDPLI